MISFTHQCYRSASKNWGSRFSVFLLGLLAGGCGGSHGEVSGKVYYKGQPLTSPGTIVTFMDTSGGVFSSSVAHDGGYALPKVPVGQAKIAVVVLPQRRIDLLQQAEQDALSSGILKMPPQGKEKSALGGGLPRRLTVAIPPAYADPEQSGLLHTVTGGKQTFDIELK